jgi:hypothetical protein
MRSIATDIILKFLGVIIILLGILYFANLFWVNWDISWTKITISFFIQLFLALTIISVGTKVYNG